MAEAQGRLFSVYAAGPRQLYSWVADLHDRGRLQGRTLGILALDDPPDVTDGVLIPALREFGYDVADVAKLSAADSSEAASQIPVAVQKMRAAGVDTVMVLPGIVHATGFVQTADRQGYRPYYLVASWASQDNYVFLEAMPDTFEGELVTPLDLRSSTSPPTPLEQECKEIYERRAGKSMGKRPPDTQDSSYAVNLIWCAIDLHLLGPALRGAGPQLTPATFVAALESLGSVALPYTNGGTYAPGKHDLQDWLMVGRFDRACHCWEPASDFRRLAR
jgi:hypothetical protein